MNRGAADPVHLRDLAFHSLGQLRARREERQMMWLRHESHEVAAQREHHRRSIGDSFLHLRNDSACRWLTTEFTTEGSKTRMTATVRYPSLEVRDMVLGSGMATGAGVSYDRLEELVA